MMWNDSYVNSQQEWALWYHLVNLTNYCVCFLKKQISAINSLNSTITYERVNNINQKPFKGMWVFFILHLLLKHAHNVCFYWYREISFHLCIQT